MSKVGDTSTCRHCGQKITYQYGGTTGSDMWMHEFNRWDFDNGYWCYHHEDAFFMNKKNMSAEPLSETR